MIILKIKQFYWKNLHKTIQSSYFSEIFTFLLLDLEVGRPNIFKTQSESFAKIVLNRIADNFNGVKRKIALSKNLCNRARSRSQIYMRIFALIRFLDLWRQYLRSSDITSALYYLSDISILHSASNFKRFSLYTS